MASLVHHQHVRSDADDPAHITLELSTRKSDGSRRRSTFWSAQLTVKIPLAEPSLLCAPFLHQLHSVTLSVVWLWWFLFTAQLRLDGVFWEGKNQMYLSNIHLQITSKKPAREGWKQTCKGAMSQGLLTVWTVKVLLCRRLLATAWKRRQSQILVSARTNGLCVYILMHRYLMHESVRCSHQHSSFHQMPASAQRKKKGVQFEYYIGFQETRMWSSLLEMFILGSSALWLANKWQNHHLSTYSHTQTKGVKKYYDTQGRNGWFPSVHERIH